MYCPGTRAIGNSPTLHMPPKTHSCSCSGPTPHSPLKEHCMSACPPDPSSQTTPFPPHSTHSPVATPCIAASQAPDGHCYSKPTSWTPEPQPLQTPASRLFDVYLHVTHPHCHGLTSTPDQGATVILQAWVPTSWTLHQQRSP